MNNNPCLSHLCSKHTQFKRYYENIYLGSNSQRKILQCNNCSNQNELDDAYYLIEIKDLIENQLKLQEDMENLKKGDPQQFPIWKIRDQLEINRQNIEKYYCWPSIQYYHYINFKFISDKSRNQPRIQAMYKIIEEDVNKLESYYENLQKIFIQFIQDSKRKAIKEYFCHQKREIDQLIKFRMSFVLFYNLNKIHHYLQNQQNLDEKVVGQFLKEKTKQGSIEQQFQVCQHLFSLTKLSPQDLDVNYHLKVSQLMNYIQDLILKQEEANIQFSLKFDIQNLNDFNILKRQQHFTIQNCVPDNIYVKLISCKNNNEESIYEDEDTIRKNPNQEPLYFETFYLRIRISKDQLPGFQIGIKNKNDPKISYSLEFDQNSINRVNMQIQTADYNNTEKINDELQNEYNKFLQEELKSQEKIDIIQGQQTQFDQFINNTNQQYLKDNHKELCTDNEMQYINIKLEHVNPVQENTKDKLDCEENVQYFFHPVIKPEGNTKQILSIYLDNDSNYYYQSVEEGQYQIFFDYLYTRDSTLKQKKEDQLFERSFSIIKAIKKIDNEYYQQMFENQQQQQQQQDFIQQ